ncbi:Dynein light chain like protein [Verticillium longisporum]|nr:Dynein light chain like protein [Verticillium longisporum]
MSTLTGHLGPQALSSVTIVTLTNTLNHRTKQIMADKGSAEAPREAKLEAQIKSADMTDDMQQEVIEVAQEAMGRFTIEKDIAQQIKKTFDERKGPTWHCIVGRNFGSFVTHETKHFIYFYLGHCAILLFKTQ